MMNVSQVEFYLKQIPQLKDFKWSEREASNVFATMPIPTKNFKDKEGNEYHLGGSYSLFVAHMYMGQKDKEFFYCIIYRSSTMRLFRKHSNDALEFNKIFASGSTVEEVVDSVKGYFEKGYTLGDSSDLRI